MSTKSEGWQTGRAMSITVQGRGAFSGLRPWSGVLRPLRWEWRPDDGWRGRYSDQVTPSLHPPPAPGRPRGDRAVSYRKSRRAVPSAAHCLPALRSSVPPPQHCFRITSPLHAHHTQIQRERLAPGPQAVPEESRERVPEAIRAPGGEQGPHLASRGGERAISRIQSPPFCSLPT